MNYNFHEMSIETHYSGKINKNKNTYIRNTNKENNILFRNSIFIKIAEKVKQSRHNNYNTMCLKNLKKKYYQHNKTHSGRKKKLLVYNKKNWPFQIYN